MTCKAVSHGFVPVSPTSPPRASARSGGAGSCTAAAGNGGFTLVELMVVLVVLAATAGLAVVASGAMMEDGRRAVTLSTMQAVRDAIVGGPSAVVTGKSFLRDVGRLPRNTPTAAAAAGETWSLCELVERGALAAYDPVARRGWRGPYVSVLRATFGDPDAVVRDPPPVFQPWAGHGDPADWAVLDGWERPVVLQVADFDGDETVTTPLELQHARLVSAGPNGWVETPRTGSPSNPYPFVASCGDDLVLYLQVPDLRPGP